MDFDWSDIGKFLSYLVPVIMFVVFNVLFRTRKQQQRRLAVVKSLLSEIDYNHGLAETFSLRLQTKKFKTATWKRNKERMDYIDQSLYSTLANVYDMAEAFNKEIDEAMRYKSTSYLAGISAHRLIEPLAKSRRALEEWIELNKAKKEVTSSQHPHSPKS